jgi:ABC-type transport system involved in multi-copper enzyme maturation permease subunit
LAQYPDAADKSLAHFLAFTTAPLMFSAAVGLLVFVIAFVLLLYYLIKVIVWGDPVSGFPTLITIVLFLGGLVMFFLGVLSQYLAKTYIEVKNRPLYIVKKDKVYTKENQ